MSRGPDKWAEEGYPVEHLEPAMVLVDRKELAELKRRSAVLNALEIGGVDNWEWYGQSLEDAGLLNS